MSIDPSSKCEESLVATSLLDGQQVPIQTVFGIGRNYAAHARELNHCLPTTPVVFLKPTTSLIQDGGTILLPSESSDVQHEVEIVLLLGGGGRNLSREDALTRVAGYGVGIDVTARDLQRRAQAEGNPWTIAKGFDTFAPISRFIPARQVPEPGNLAFDLSVNGQTRQSGNSRDMLFSFGEIISFLSRIFSLRKGDIIFTGTPEGVARIEPRDVLQARLTNHGVTLNVSVAQAPSR